MHSTTEKYFSLGLGTKFQNFSSRSRDGANDELLCRTSLSLLQAVATPWDTGSKEMPTPSSQTVELFQAPHKLVTLQSAPQAPDQKGKE